MPVPKERRQSPGESEEGLLERLPHHVLYPFIGLALGAVLPIGAFLIRFWLANPVFKLLWIRSELSYNAVFYLYMEA